MTILEKLSDRNGFIYEAILLVLNNVPGPFSGKDLRKLQWELFKCGVYVKKPLLMQALVVMKEKKMIGDVQAEKKENPEAETSKASSPIIQP